MSHTADRAIVTVSVSLSPEETFRIFTTEIDQWWKHGPRYRLKGADLGGVGLEPRLGGMLFQVRGEERVEFGRVLAWEPPARLLMSWRNANFAPGESTEVEVRFAPSSRGTLVTLEHRGWDTIRLDHPARHGLTGAPFAAFIGSWWGDLLMSVRERARQRSDVDRPV